jgi:hypothetical protein
VLNEAATATLRPAVQARRRVGGSTIRRQRFRGVWVCSEGSLRARSGVVTLDTPHCTLYPHGTAWRLAHLEWRDGFYDTVG